METTMEISSSTKRKGVSTGSSTGCKRSRSNKMAPSSCLKETPSAVEAEVNFCASRTTTTTGLQLADLFATKKVKHGLKENGRKEEHSENYKGLVGDAFFSLRMEHRKMGLTEQRYRGEERILIFADHESGPIAKVVYSSERCSTAAANVSTNDMDGGKETKMTRRRLVATAKILSLSVKEQYRGYHLGGLLFSEAMARLKERYFSMAVSRSVYSQDDYDWIHCRLEVEEDVRGHNRLVQFYQRLGCTIRKDARVTFLYNPTNGESFRRVPMQVNLVVPVPPSESTTTSRTLSFSSKSLVGTHFLPLALRSADGVRFRRANKNNMKKENDIDSQWLVIQLEHGELGIRPTADVEGVEEEVQLGTFQLLHVFSGTKESSFCHDELSTQQIQKDLFAIGSVCGTYFLGVDPWDSNFIQVTKNPCFWEIDGDRAFSMKQTTDTPARRTHYRQMQARQNVEYATRMQSQFSSYDRARMTIADALDYAKNLPSNPFIVLPCKNNNNNSPSLRRLLFQTAEFARKEEHPDWFQFIALIFGLAPVLNSVFASQMGGGASDAAASSDSFDWTICCAGSCILSSPSFSSVSGAPCTMKDFHSTTTSSGDVLLSWSGPEFMVRMLHFNQITLPEEAFIVLRLFPLVNGHHPEGASLFGINHRVDAELKAMEAFAFDFYHLFQMAQASLSNGTGVTENECDALWESYYSFVANKYSANGTLKW